MLGKDLIQPDEQKRPLFEPNEIGISLLGSDFWYSGEENVITDKNNKVVKWCDVRRSKWYMFWQRVKYRVFGKL